MDKKHKGVLSFGDFARYAGPESVTQSDIIDDFMTSESILIPTDFLNELDGDAAYVAHRLTAFDGHGGDLLVLDLLKPVLQEYAKEHLSTLQNIQKTIQAAREALVIRLLTHASYSSFRKLVEKLGDKDGANGRLKVGSKTFEVSPNLYSVFWMFHDKPKEAVQSIYDWGSGEHLNKFLDNPEFQRHLNHAREDFLSLLNSVYHKHKKDLIDIFTSLGEWVKF